MTAEEYADLTQDQRRLFLIRALLRESKDLTRMDIAIPPEEESQQDLLRALFNIRPPRPASVHFLGIQDAYLQERIAEKGITDYASLKPVAPDTYLWRGDITTIACDAIVNAANSEMLGCFVPGHRCIDNAIHTYAGIQLRLACAKMMRQQRHSELPGRAKITAAYNLPSKRILHTVGPIVRGGVSHEDDRLLESCYRSCLELADQNGIESIAFCCISTGEFQFPATRAAKIAINTVDRYREQTGSRMKVIYDVFSEEDEEIYNDLL